MTDDLRWAARYAFLEDLWRGQARVIVDAGLEAVLRQLPSRSRREDGPRTELVDALVPRVPRARTWVAVADEAVARELAQTRPGAGFLPRGSFGDVVAHREWSVALVELEALADEAPGGVRLREQLAERARDGRTVIVSARVRPGAGDEDPAFTALSDLLEDELGGGRIYGLYRPPMAAVVDFGGGEDDEDESDEVPLSFDNTLGSQAPEFVEYVGIVGGQALPEGMTLVELPASAGDGGGVAAVDDGLRDQLLQAQRQAELAAIDRQALLEKVDELESAQARLERQAGELRDHLARAVTQQPPEAEHDERLQAAMAEAQALRWTVQQLERELEEAKARPVEALEAEVAQLRARLGGDEAAEGEAIGGEDAAEASLGEANSGDGGDESEGEVGDEIDLAGLDEILVLEPGEDEIDEVRERAERMRVGDMLRQLERLIERVERGGIGALQLRQTLVGLRRRLRG